MDFLQQKSLGIDAQNIYIYLFLICQFVLLFLNIIWKKGLTEDEISDYSDDIEISHDSNGLLTISLSCQGDESEDGDDDNSSIWTVGAHKISVVDNQGQHDFAKGYTLGVENESGRRLNSVMKKRSIFDMHEVIIDSSCSAFVIWTDLEDEIPGILMTSFKINIRS